MKKYLILSICFVLVSCYPQETIKLQRVHGGLFITEATLNNKLQLPFVLDTGCAMTTIPSHIARTLVDSGTLTPEDLVGKETFVMANGTKEEQVIIRIKSLKIGTRTFHNVMVSVSNQGILLLGQDIMSKMGVVTFDYNNNTLKFK